MRKSDVKTRLRIMISHFGITQRELSRKTGIREATICLYMTGKREPNARYLCLIADAMQVSPSWILGYGDDDKMERM